MSTPMTLMLRVKDEDINTRKKFDEKLLPENFETGAMLESSEKDDRAVRAVDLKGKFIKIYVHWNGHPDDCARDLLKFNTYEKVLNLLLLGNCSCINSHPDGKDGLVDTTSHRRIIKPYIMEPTRADLQEHKTPSFGASDKALDCTEYAYKFVDGKWFVKCTDEGYEYDDWTPLEEHLENDVEPQVHITLAANKGSVADALRELATYIEEWDSDKSTEYPTQYESDICVAQITEETDLRESFAALIRSKGYVNRLDVEDLVDLNWTFVGEDGDCWTLPLTELVIDKKKKDIFFVFENNVKRFEVDLNDMEDDMLDAVVEAFDEWL